MSTIVIDGLNEEDFRRSIENRLREARAGVAIERLRSLLAPFARPGGVLPERFLTVAAADLVLSGWDALEDAVGRHDQPGRPVTALSVAFGWPGDDVPEPDGEGRLRPHIETSYFSDNAYPFSQSKREDLLDGYSFYGCTWSGDAEATDTVLSLEGIDDLHGALAGLEARLLASDEPDEEHIRAGSLGACLLSVLLVQAVTDRVARDGLPRPLCVMAGSSGVYPYFDAPVAGMTEVALKEVVAQEDIFEASYGAPAPRYSSLLMTGIPHARKRAILVLEESEDELANRIARLRNLNHADGEEAETRREAAPAASVPEMPDAMPDPVPAATGNGSLLAQKPARKATDLRDMLGPRETVPCADVTPIREPADWDEPVNWNEQAGWSDQAGWDEPAEQAEPALPTARGEPPAGPDFTLLEADLQQRLQNLLSANALPVAEAPWPEPPIPADEPAPDWPGGPGWEESSRAPTPRNSLRARAMAQPVRPGARARMSAWVRGKVEACLARFGL